MTESKRIEILLILIVVIMALPSRVWAGWSFEVETGVADAGYNNVRIPGNTGTKLSLTDDLDSKSTLFGRWRITKDIGDRHHVSLLVAPLRLKSSGALDREIEFAGQSFPASMSLQSRFRFDSYRLTYRYDLVNKQKIAIGLGVTAKIRDASISIEGTGISAEKTNTGFVPLVNFSIDWRFKQGVGAIVEGDALAAPQGRAEDVLFAFYKDFGSSLRSKIGYRILEGGADNDEVYSFTLVNYLVVGFVWNL